MTLDRRDFLKSTLGGSAGLAVGGACGQAQARDNLEMPPEAVGLLFDSTLCIGCKACVVACKIANNLPSTAPIGKAYLDETKELSHQALNVIQMCTEGKPVNKDQVEDGFAFFKHSCMHCVDPSCVSACPVTALEKDPVNGVVSWRRDACIGCRYCVMACPFRIPQFDYTSASPEIYKCQLCNHLWKDGQYSACAYVCPTGATLFGPVDKLLAESKRRLSLKPGEETQVPRGSTETGKKARKRPVAKYVDHIYGEKEGGGTQMLMLSGMPFEKFGLPNLKDVSAASISETVQHTLYNYLVLPTIALGGLMALTWRTRKSDDENHNHDGGEV